jgi:hypothetical protein
MELVLLMPDLTMAVAGEMQMVLLTVPVAAEETQADLEGLSPEVPEYGT